MEGQIVKIHNPDLVKFLYPNYRVREEVSLLDRDQKVLYVGQPKRDLSVFLSQRTSNFISVSGTPTLDLSTNKKLLEWAATKKGKELSERILNSIDSMEEDQFEYCFKIYWVTGKWVSETEEDGSTYELFKATSGSIKELFCTAYDLMDKYPFPIVEASYLTFLQRVKNVDDQNVNPSYLRVLKSASVKIGPKITRAVAQYAVNKGLRPDLQFVSLLLSLR